MKNKIAVSIGIPAYFAEKNIYNLVYSLTKQKQKNQTIKEIIVYSDNSKDSTVEEARRVKDNRVKVIDSKKRGGFAAGFRYLISNFKGEALLLLNDDVRITDNNFLDKLVKPLNNQKVGLVSGNPRPLAPKTFVEKSAILTFNAYEEIRYSIRNGNNKHTCDGKTILLSRSFAKNIKFPKNLKEMGNVDAYVYLSCIANGFLYKHVRKAKNYYKFPDNLRDYINLTIRNNTNIYILRKKFGELTDKEYRIPKEIMLKAFLRQFISSPFESLFIFIVGRYCKIKAVNSYSSFSPKWEVIKSSKTRFDEI